MYTLTCIYENLEYIDRQSSWAISKHFSIIDKNVAISSLLLKVEWPDRNKWRILLSDSDTSCVAIVLGILAILWTSQEPANVVICNYCCAL